MPKIKNLKNTIVGDLLVLEKVGVSSKGFIRWKSRCLICKKELVGVGYELRRSASHDKHIG